MRILLAAILASTLTGQAPERPTSERQAPERQALAPCDPELVKPTRPANIFVRMRNQLFANGSAYPAYCKEHATSKRSELRAQNLADLQARADRSWRAVAEVVDRLGKDGSLRGTQRFWIVNGFAATANADAIAALRKLPEVAFVHRQSQPGRPQQQVVARNANWLAKRKKDEAKAVAMRKARKQEAPFDADGLDIPWNLKVIAADKAWQLGATGKGVTIAMLDSGVLCFEPLVHALWRNPGEQLDGKDTDGNGYVDDLFGWDFGGDNRFALGDGAKSHGTMCGGILAGRPWGEPKTVTGVAPRAQLMVMRGMGKLRAYEYAAANGADVLSMSYMWVNVELGSFRGVFRTAHEHLAACGVVSVGGAGNYARSAKPGHQITLPKDIPCVIAAAGIGDDGNVPAFSSRGPCTWHDVPFFEDYPANAPLHKPDITGCAAGFPIWHWAKMKGRKLNVQWQNEQGFGLVVGPRGNSFSGPHAGGTAALMLSAQPELTPWRVQQLMIATCKDVGDEGWDKTHGAGLLQADAAVRAARAATIQ